MQGKKKEGKEDLYSKFLLSYFFSLLELEQPPKGVQQSETLTIVALLFNGEI